MPNQKQKNKTSGKNLTPNKAPTKKSNKKQNSSRPIIILLLVLIIGIVSVVLINNNRNKTGNGQTEYEKRLKELQDSGQIYTQLNEDLSMTNISPKIAEGKTIDNLEIKNIKMDTVDNVTTITADVINNGQEVAGDYMVNLRFFDDSGNQIVEIGAYINPVEPEGTNTILAKTEVDFVNAYDFQIIK